MNSNEKIIIAGCFIISISGLILIRKVIKKNMDVSKNIKSILFIGDSNTAANFSYADKIKNKFPELKVKKIAKSSMQTDWMYNELVKELSSNKYDVVSILGGSNDIYGTGKNTKAKDNLDKMYKLAKSKGSKVVAITPPNKNFYNLKTESKQKELFDLNNWIKINANKDYELNFWDITNNIKFFSPSDGFLHAQSPAHEILANEFIKKLNIK